MRLHLIRTVEELERLEQPWNALLARSVTPSIFLTWVWLYHWWRAFGDSKELYIMVLEDEGRWVGVAPLFRSTGAGGIRRLRFLGSETVGSDYLNFILDRDYEQESLQAIFSFLQEREDWDALLLNDVPADCRNLRWILGRGRSEGHAVVRLGSTVCPYATLPESWEGYFGRLTASERYDIRRKVRAIRRHGEMGFSFVGNGAGLAPALGQFAALNRERLTRKGVRGGFLDPRFARFHEQVLPELQRRDHLRLCFLEVDGDRIAGLYLLKQDSRYYYYQSGLQTAWERCSPGTVLFASAIRHGIEHEGIREFDMLRGAEPYKFRWSTGTRRIITFQLSNRTPRGTLIACYGTLKRGVRRALRGLREVDHAA